MSKTLIVTGGSINVAWAKEWLDNQTFDYCIAADSGLHGRLQGAQRVGQAGDGIEPHHQPETEPKHIGKGLQQQKQAGAEHGGRDQ